MTSAILHVPGISCEHCAGTIRHALGQTPGVRHVDVDISARQVRVSYDETAVDLERLTAVLEAEEYAVAWVTPAGG
jgi:copper chaperone